MKYERTLRINRKEKYQPQRIKIKRGIHESNAHK